ncbi:polyprotein [Phytophthora megakarya]|uniref:Polyprotein n=1 Tax=Phytophthora megakarya TaxID=4795 RepID=A0A225VWY0_9STRA|nr:polyprotein [Phytophthora megakarya]
MNDTSMNETCTTSRISLEHASFSCLLVIEWEALHRLAAASGDSVIKEMLMVASVDYHAGQANSDIVNLDVFEYSGEGEGRLHLNQHFYEVDIAVEARQIS